MYGCTFGDSCETLRNIHIGGARDIDLSIVSFVPSALWFDFVPIARSILDDLRTLSVIFSKFTIA